MAFRPPQQEQQGVPSLGYRLSSNRQPGIEQSNNRMPNQQQQGNPYEGRRFPTPEQYRRGKPEPMPMPSPDREFDFRRNMPLPAPMPSPDYDRSMPMPFPFERGGQEDPMPFPSPNFDPREYENFLQEDMGIMGALPQETQMAELSQPQLDFMGSTYGRPDFFSNYQDYKNAVDSYEDKGFLGGMFGGGQEPATDPEIIKQLRETYGTIPFQVPGIV